MAEVTYPYLRGFIVQDPAFSVDNLAAVLPAQADPGPGVPTHDDPRSLLALATSGSQDQVWDVEVTRAGFPGKFNCGVLYRLEGASPTLDGDRLWSPPNQLTELRAVRFVAGAATFTGAGATSYPNGDILVVTALGGRLWDTSARAWLGVLGHAPAGDACLVLSDGRALVLRFVLVPATGSYQCTVYQYDRDTDTTALYSEFALDVAVGAPIGASAAEHNGNVLLMVEDGVSLYQYGSNDVGTNFTLQATINGTWQDGKSVAKLPDGRFMVVYRNTADFPTARILGSPFDLFTDASPIAISTTATISQDLTACVDYDGFVYVFAREPVAGPPGASVLQWFTPDNGAIWHQFLSPALNTTLDTSSLLPFAACPTNGQIALVGGFVSAGTGGWTFDGDSILLLWLGGWGSAETDGHSAPLGFPANRLYNRVGSGAPATAVTWYGTDHIDSPASLVGAGAGTRTIETSFGGVEYLHTAFTNERTVSWSALNNSGLIKWEGFVRTGGSQSAANAYLRMDTALKGFELWMDRAGFSIRNHLGASLGGNAAYPITETQPIQFLLHVHGTLDAALEVLYKRPWDTVWTTITAVLTGTFGTSLFRIGTTLGHSLATGHFWAVSEAGPGRNWLVRTGQAGTFWEKPGGRGLNALPYPLGDLTASGDVTFLRGKGGPGFIEELQSLPLSYPLPLSNIFPIVAPSPDDMYDAGNDASDVDIEWDFGAGNPHLIGGTTSGGALIVNPEFRTAEFQVFSGAWLTAATLNMAAGFEALSWARSGHHIRITAGTGARYVKRNEFAGGIWYFDTGEARKILANNEGAIGTTGRRPVFLLDGVMPAGTSGTAGKLGGRSGVMIWHEIAATGYQRYRLHIPAQATPNGRIRLGTCLLGGLAIPGLQYARGYPRETIANATITEDSRGTSHVTKLGRPRRRWAIAYSDLPLRTLQSGTPDHIAARSGAAAVATRYDVVGMYEGILGDTDSNRYPVCLVVDIPLSTGAFGSGNSYKQVHGIDSHLYCRMGDSVRFDQNAGYELQNEAGALQVIPLDEVV